MPKLKARDNEVFSNASKEYWLLWGVAIFWNAITWFAIIKGGNNILRAFDESPIFYFFVLFPFIGVWTVISAIRQTWAWHKFGKTPVSLSPFPAQIGGQCAGYMLLPKAAETAKQAELNLSCIHSYSYRSSNNEYSRREEVLWNDKIRLKPERYGRKFRLNFSFNPPADLPETSDEQGDSYHLWRLHIHIPLNSIDYERSFELPVQHVEAQQLVAASSFTEPRSESIEIPDPQIGLMPQIESTMTSTQFSYGSGRSKGMGISLLLVGVFIAAFGYLFFAEFTDFLFATTLLVRIYMGLIALSLCLLGFFLIFNSLSVEVSANGLHKRQRIFGYVWENFTPTADISNMTVERNGSSSTAGHATRVWYSIKLYRHDKSHIEVGDSLEGQRYAESIRQQMLTALGSAWTEDSAFDPAEKMPKRPIPTGLHWLGRLLPHSFLIAFVYDLSQKWPEITAFIAPFFK
ncbi:MAG: hypothetical protein GQ582_06670 [Methyloprofundus sp.]|nr:hypothetical protein [Methyloprofundus sp.]